MEIAKHMRIVRAVPEDDFIEKRQKAIQSLSALYEKKLGGEHILELAGAISAHLSSANSPLPSPITDETAQIISNEAPSFVADEDTELEIAVCVSLCVLQILRGKPNDPAVAPLAGAFALALSSICECKEQKIEALRQDLLLSAYHVVRTQAIESRKRKLVNVGKVPAQKEGETIEAWVPRVFGHLGTRLGSAVENAEKDHEEIDLLWWTLNGRSKLLDRHLSKIQSPDAAVIAGVEFASMLQSWPADAHRDLAVRNLQANGGEIAFAELAKIKTETRKQLLLSIGSGSNLVVKYPTIFAALWVASHCTTSNDAEKQIEAAGLNLVLKQTCRDWGRRVVDEVSVLSNLGWPPTLELTDDEAV